MESALPVEENSLRWLLVFTKPSGEATAKANLERQGFQVYFPRVSRKVLFKSAWRHTISALFPRYVFVRINAAMQSLAPIRSTLGVSNVVRFGDEYISVPDRIVEDLVGREDERGLHQLSFVSRFKVGAAVRILEGAFAGIEGIFDSEDASDRIVVLLNLLGRESRLTLPACDVAPVAADY